MDSLIQKLERRRAGYSEAAANWDLVADVLEARLRQEKYLPRHSIEDQAEWKKRLQLTPLYTVSGEALEARLGAMSRARPTFALPESLAYLADRATARGATLQDVAIQGAKLAQTTGHWAILVDRQPPPEGTVEPISVAEQQRTGAGRLRLAVYAGAAVLDWSEDGRGLEWIKLEEAAPERQTWDADPQAQRRRILIVDRIQIAAYDLTRSTSGEWRPSPVGEPVLHGCADATGPQVPAVLFRPFPDEYGWGQPVLWEVAEADRAATVVLSELAFTLYMACPLLGLTTDREEKEIADIGIGSSRFVVLRKGLPPATDETLKWIQYDPTVITQLSAQWDKLSMRARDAARMGSLAAREAVEQSGISRAWSFRTGEERVLFLTAMHLQEQFALLLRRAAQMDRGDPEAVAVTYPDSYDLTPSPERERSLRETLGLAATWGLNALAMETLRALVSASAGTRIAPAVQAKIEAEIAALADQDLRRIAPFEFAAAQNSEGAPAG
jgi:hypothetical protein